MHEWIDESLHRVDPVAKENLSELHSNSLDVGRRPGVLVSSIRPCYDAVI
jgi:hypothetical protein